MMDRLTSVRVSGFRCLGACTFEPDDDLTVIVGGNASGKSSLLDAIQVVADLVRLGDGAWSGELRGAFGESRLSGEQFITNDGKHDRVEIGLEFTAGGRVFTYTLALTPAAGALYVASETLTERMQDRTEALLLQRDASGARLRRGSGSQAQLVPVGTNASSPVLTLAVDAVSYPDLHLAWRFVRGISILRLLPPAMRTGGQPTSELPLPDRYGADLAARLHRLQTSRPGSVAAWLEHLHGLVGWVEMHTPVQRGAVRPRFIEGRNPHPVDLLHVSDGSVVQAYLAALVLDPPEETSVYLLDDPGMPYFPSDAAHGAELVRALAGTRQVIVATHSVALVETVGNLDNVWRIEREAGEPAALARIDQADDLYAEDVALRGIGEAVFAATRSIAASVGEE